MKKVIVGIMLVLGAFSLVQASGAANWSVTDANYVWKLDTVISSSAKYDSVIGNASPADSIAILSNYSFTDQEWQRILVHDTVSGTIDSCTLQVVVKCEDASGNRLYEFYPDSVNGTNGAAYELDFGGGAIGHRFDVIIRAIAATERGNQIKFNRISIYKRRAISTGTRTW